MTAFSLEQLIRYDYTAPVADLCQRLIVVPRAGHGGQRRRSWSLHVAGPTPFRARSRVDTFGNHAITVTARHVPAWVEFAVSSEVVVDRRSTGRRLAPDRRYFASTRLTAPDANISALALETGADAARICSAVHAAFAYEYGVTAVSTTAAEALALGRGVCQDYAHVMLSACRLAGIPARYVSGHLVGEGGSHAWVEVLRPRGRHWVAEGWDPTHGCPTDDAYITVAVGRDYADVAPLSGTYNAAGVEGTLTVSKRLRQSQHGVHLAEKAGKQATPMVGVDN